MSGYCSEHLTRAFSLSVLRGFAAPCSPDGYRHVQRDVHKHPSRRRDCGGRWVNRVRYADFQRARGTEWHRARDEASLGVLRVLVALTVLVGGIAHAERKVITETSIEIIGPIEFVGASAQLHPGKSTTKMLDAIAQTFLGNPSITKVEIRAYGADAKFQRGLLGAQRARTIVAALVARGVESKRLVARGYGAPRTGDSADPSFFILARETEPRGGLLQNR
jgi:outer membrane protein OmpA-like peptidoglycan-associated protein